MVVTRRLLGKLAAMSALGGLPPQRPDQRHNPGQPALGAGPHSNVLARLRVANSVINANGMFFYNGPPAAGNLFTSLGVTTAGADPKGNAYLTGDTVYYPLGGGPFGATQLSPFGGVVFWSAPSEAGPWAQGSQVTGFASVGFLPTFSLAASGQFVVANASLGLPDGLSIGQGLGFQVLVNGSTISTAGITQRPVTAAASVTGIILQAGTFDGQVIDIPSDAAVGVTITFAATATSHVKLGTAAVLQPGRLGTFRWVASTAAWYLALTA